VEVLRMPEPPRILFIDDEKKLCSNMQALLTREGYRVDTAETGNAGLQRLNESPYDLVITDVIMPDVPGIEIVRYVRDFLPDTLAIVITGYATLEGAISAMRKGAYDYLTKPIDFDFLKLSIERALERVRLSRTIKSYTEELEQRVQERTRELEKAQAQLLRAERLATIGEMAAHVAHEIKNPLTSMGGLVRLLQKKAHKAEKTQEIAAVVLQEVERLERILGNLLDLRRDRPIKYKSLQPHNLLKETVGLLAPELEKASVSVHWDLSKDLPRIPADEDRMKQVLLNLCTNAIQAMPAGGVLTLRTLTGPDCVVLEITDTGEGIPPEQLNRVFTPFYTTKKQGTGLGLAICEKLVRDHGGRIEVQSRPGQGTTFHLELPLTLSPSPT
jgi:signal transduction histidine kinase